MKLLDRQPRRSSSNHGGGRARAVAEGEEAAERDGRVRRSDSVDGGRGVVRKAGVKGGGGCSRSGPPFAAPPARAAAAAAAAAAAVATAALDGADRIRACACVCV